MEREWQDNLWSIFRNKYIHEYIVERKMEKRNSAAAIDRDAPTDFSPIDMNVHKLIYNIVTARYWILNYAEFQNPARTFHEILTFQSR